MLNGSVVNELLLERVWKEVVMVHFEVLYWVFHGGIKEKYK
jgi:hypothetical protein